MKQALAALPVKERKAIESLTKHERKKRLYGLMRKRYAAEKDRVKKEVIKELGRLLSLSPKKFDEEMKKSKKGRSGSHRPTHRRHR